MGGNSPDHFIEAPFWRGSSTHHFVDVFFCTSSFCSHFSRPYHFVIASSTKCPCLTSPYKLERGFFCGDCFFFGIFWEGLFGMRFASRFGFAWFRAADCHG